MNQKKIATPTVAASMKTTIIAAPDTMTASRITQDVTMIVFTNGLLEETGMQSASRGRGTITTATTMRTDTQGVFIHAHALPSLIHAHALPSAKHANLPHIQEDPAVQLPCDRAEILAQDHIPAVLVEAEAEVEHR